MIYIYAFRTKNNRTSGGRSLATGPHLNDRRKEILGQSGSLKAFMAEMTAFFISNDRDDKCFFLSGCMGTVIRHK